MLKYCLENKAKKVFNKTKEKRKEEMRISSIGREQEGNKRIIIR